MNIPKPVFEIAKCCDVESSRYALGAVRLERDEEGPLAVTTDGRRLLCARMAMDDEGEPGFTSLIPKKTWGEVGRLAKKGQAVYFDETTANGKIDCAVGDTRKTIDTEEGRFPELWRENVPNRDPHEELSVSITPRLLGEILMVMDKANITTATLSVPLSGVDAIKVTGDTTEQWGNMTGVLMPVVYDDKESQREKAKAKATRELLRLNGIDAADAFAAALDMLTPEQAAELRRRFVEKETESA